MCLLGLVCTFRPFTYCLEIYVGKHLILRSLEFQFWEGSSKCVFGAWLAYSDPLPIALLKLTVEGEGIMPKVGYKSLFFCCFLNLANHL